MTNSVSSRIESVSQKFNADPNITWAEPQMKLVRAKRGRFSSTPSGHAIFSGSNGLISFMRPNSLMKPQFKVSFKDPSFEDQWYLKVDTARHVDDIDMKIDRAWLMGLTGRGIVVSIVDDGK